MNLPDEKDKAYLKFENFNFKLAIIQELMYEQEVLAPKFDAYDYCDKHGIDIDGYYCEIIPEIRECLIK